MCVRSMRRAALGSALLALIGFAPAQAAFVNFESGQVRPLALSPDGTRLFAVNTPDGRLEMFSVLDGNLTHITSIAVGLEPVAVAARNDSEVWVVNHLSDSISIVDVASTPPRVVRTIMTCDEPRDIVFAGPGDGRAFVTTARRGQNCAAFAQSDLTTAGIGRAVVQVYDTANLGNGLRANPTNVVLFGDTPRALARSADGNTVYAAVFHSGNQTTTLNEGFVCDGGDGAGPCIVAGGRLAPGGMPAPNMNFEGVMGPENGLIVKFDPDSGVWFDNVGRDWSDVVRFQLPDFDVFAIDAAAPIPVETANFAHVGTVLFNIAVNPVSGVLYVSNTDARNEVRFEGPAIFAGTAATTVQGHLHEARVTVINGGVVTPRHLNKHIDYEVRPAPPAVKPNSLASPVGMAVSSDGTTLYVAALGSSKIGIFSTAALENDSFVPSAGSHIAVSGGGPTGLVLDEAAQRLYVLTRFDNSISVVDLDSNSEIAHLPLFNPEPAEIVGGRSLLYDAVTTSSNGEASCASCHIFGDFDSLAWDLGNPDDEVLNRPLPSRIGVGGNTFPDFHPLKGPMTTQSLRGMSNHGSMHWRGDRTGGNDPGGDVFDEDAAFKKFNAAFPGLIGRDSELSAAQMQAFTDFILTVHYPPNPIRNLDQTLTTNQQLGRDLYFGPVTDVVFDCNGCHTLDPAQGFFGGDGFDTFEGETQMFKVPHLRNVYQKIGMFGRPQDANAGPQVRGVGVLHDGSIDTVFRFLGSSVFSLTNAEQRQLEQFVFAFDAELAPIVGQQATVSATSNTGIAERADLLLARAALNECDVVVKTTLAGIARGAYRLPDGTFQFDREDEAPMAEPALRALALTPGQEITYTCVPPGSGLRLGVDRDEDSYLDRDELDVGTDPDDADDFPGAGALSILPRSFKMKDDATAPIDAEKRKLTFRSVGRGATPSGVTAPPFDTPNDPSLAGGRLLVSRADGTGLVSLPLPAANWQRTGSPSSPGYRYRDRDRLAGPIQSITLKAGKLVVRGKGAGLFSLAGAPQGAMALRLELGGDFELCTATQADLPATSNDTTAKFKGDRDAGAPALCPRKPLN